MDSLWCPLTSSAKGRHWGKKWQWRRLRAEYLFPSSLSKKLAASCYQRPCPYRGPVTTQLLSPLGPSSSSLPSPLDLQVSKVPWCSSTSPLPWGQWPLLAGWFPVSLPTAANWPFIKHFLVTSARVLSGYCQGGGWQNTNQTDHSRISLTESTWCQFPCNFSKS